MKKMFAFKTRNSIYFLNQKSKQISGGCFNHEIVPYSDAHIEVGLPAEIDLTDGRKVRTSTVLAYL